MHHPTDRIAHIMAFVTPEHWLELEKKQIRMLLILIETVACLLCFDLVQNASSLTCFRYFLNASCVADTEM